MWGTSVMDCVKLGCTNEQWSGHCIKVLTETERRDGTPQETDESGLQDMTVMWINMSALLFSLYTGTYSYITG